MSSLYVCYLGPDLDYILEHLHAHMIRDQKVTVVNELEAKLEINPFNIFEHDLEAISSSICKEIQDG